MTPERTTTHDKVVNIIKGNAALDVANIKDESRVKEDLNFDSLDCIEAVLELEEEFNINIPDADAEKLLTVGSIVEYVEGKVKNE